MANVESFPGKFHPAKGFDFPKRSFGSKGEKRSFRYEWCEKFCWLHYDVALDAAFCYVCMKANHEKKLLSSTRRDPAFITKGFVFWKEATSSFTKHAASACHREAVASIEKFPKQFGDVGDLLSSRLQKEKSLNRDMLRRIVQNLRFLARQGLALRGSGSGLESNFSQLMRVRAYDCPEVLTWMEKKASKYVSGEIQNEFLQLMSLNITRQICSNIQKSRYYTIMADECTDTANIEQFSICIRWVDSQLDDHEDVIGLYAVDKIDSESLYKAIKDVLLRMNLSISKCRGQCYDGASNMIGSKTGVATRIQAEEGRAVLTHCYGHALNLAVGNAMKQSKHCRDALDTAFEIAKLIRFSPKRNAAFDNIRAENASEDDSPNVGIRSFCPTRWTVRGNALESIVENYDALNRLWSQCLETRLDPDVKGRIIGVQTQMKRYNFLFGIHLSKKILKITDNLSRALQSRSLSAAEGQEMATLSVKTLQRMRTEEGFNLFYQLVNSSQQQLHVEEPVLPRKRKVSIELEVGAGQCHFSTTIEAEYRRHYFEAFDVSISAITTRFDQPGFRVYRNTESLLIKACNEENCDAYLEEVCQFYKDDISRLELQTQLQLLGTHFSEQEGKVTFRDCLQYLKSLSEEHRQLFQEVCTLIRLILVMPATNATSERCFSAMRRLKTWLRSTMDQKRLNHVMILNVNKDKLDALDLDTICREFVAGNEHRLSLFGKF